MSEHIVGGVNIEPFEGHSAGPWRTASDAGHPCNIRITSNGRRHIAKVYADSMSGDDACEANAWLIIAAADPATGYIAQLRKVEALESERRWIPVGERLPADHERVIAYFKKGNLVVEATCIDGRWFIDGYGIADSPSHWQPLPSPPKEVEP